MRMINLLRFAAALVFCLIVAPAALTQKKACDPTRAIRIIVPFPPGGPTDVNIRIIAQRMSEDWKQPVVIDNRPGANTAIGAQASRVPSRTATRCSLRWTRRW